MVNAQRDMSYICKMNYLRLVLVMHLASLCFSCKEQPTRHKNRKAVVPAGVQKDKKNLALIPLGRVEAELMLYVEKAIRDFYPCTTSLEVPHALPLMAYYKARDRYRADSLLKYLHQVKPAAADFVLGITAQDISTTSPPYADWGVFGLGYQPGDCSVISSFRLRKGVSKPVLYDRIVKVALHEAGHNYGLTHCTNSKTCFMQDAGGKLETVNREEKRLCSYCQSTLQALLR
jgi:archaemetzincin